MLAAQYDGGSANMTLHLVIIATVCLTNCYIGKECIFYERIEAYFHLSVKSCVVSLTSSLAASTGCLSIRLATQARNGSLGSTT